MRQFIDEWELASGGPGSDLDLSIAPFRLLAIVNRVDLLQVSNGKYTSAGEARLIFGAVEGDPSNPIPSDVGQFFVIFEYGIPASSCADIQKWATQWRALSGHAAFDESYRIRLQGITDQFTTLGSGNDLNGTLLNQVRTDDFNLPGQSSPFWELREFNIVPQTPGSQVGALKSVTTKQEPGFKFTTVNAFQDKLSVYLAKEQDDILAGTHIVPTTYDFGSGVQEVFRTGIAKNDSHRIPGEISFPSGIGTRWNAPDFDNAISVPLINAQTRAAFAQQTCSGCHC